MSLRAHLHRLLTFVLVASLLPGWGELVENALHLYNEGHLAHVEEHDDVDYIENDDAEHGCTPVAHICGCHSSMPAILSDSVLAQPPLILVVEKRPPGTEQHPKSRANAPPTPHPIA